jgi:GH24 family phage-related lysozyme (muramidase)
LSFYTDYGFNLVRRYTPCRIHLGFEEYTSYKATEEDGPWLIGYGSKKIGRHTVTCFTKATRKEVDEQLKKDLEHFSEYVSDLVYMPLNEKKKGAVLSYAQSVGLPYFKDCKLLSLINSNASRNEIIKEWSPFMRRNYQSNDTLRDRRRSELDLYLQSDVEVPLLVEHHCVLPQCLLNLPSNYNGSPQQVEAVEYLENKLLELDPGGEIVDKFFELWNAPPLATGSREAFPEASLKDLEPLRYASSLIPQQTEKYLSELDEFARVLMIEEVEALTGFLEETFESDDSDTTVPSEDPV